MSIKHSTVNIIKQVRQSSIDSLSDKKSIIDLKIKEVENLAYQIFSNADLGKLQRATTLSTQEYIMMAKVIDNLIQIVSTHELIDSIYIFDTKNEYILSDTKYTMSNFGDLDAIKLGLKKEFQVVRRQLAGNDVVTYIHRLRSLLYNSDIIIVINIDYSHLFNIRPEQSSSIFDTLIFNDDYSMILLDSRNLTSIDARIMDDISNAADTSGLYIINRTEYFACKVRSDILDWNMVYLQPYSSIVQQAALIKRLIVSSLIVVLLLSFVLAYVYSIYIYHPIGRLATKVRNQVTPDSGKVKNAYKSIDSAIIKLFHENTELVSKYQTVFPHFKQYSVNNLLSGEMFDPVKFANILNLLGIRFIYSRYVNVVIDFENTEFSEKEREFLDSALSGFKKEIVYIVFNINVFRASIIINTDMKDHDIYEMMDTVKQALNGKSIELTISIGNSYDHIGNAYSQHREVLVQMDGKFFTGKNQIILSKDRSTVARKFIYDKKLEEELVSCVVNTQDKEGAIQALNQLVDKIVNNNGSIDYIRYVYFQVIYNVMDALNGIGIDSGKANMSSAEIFDKIHGSHTIDDLREFADNTIFNCITLIDEYRKIQHEVIVDKVLDFLKYNFNNDIGLDEVSKKVFLSPGNLNSIFRTVTGFSIYEYITKIRMETAIKLLADSDCKIQEIASRVGYNNIQSFFRLFKKHYNMTPIEYRRRLG